MADLIQVTGLWKNTKANGETYFSGKMGAVKVLIFENKHKTKDSQPHFQMYFAPSETQHSNAPSDRERDAQAEAQDDEFHNASPDELLGNGSPRSRPASDAGHDPAFNEGQNARTASAPATTRAPEPARPRPANMPAPAARPAPAPARPAPAHPRSPMRRSTPEPAGASRYEDYDDMGDLADPFAE